MSQFRRRNWFYINEAVIALEELLKRIENEIINSLCYGFEIHPPNDEYTCRAVVDQVTDLLTKISSGGDFTVEATTVKDGIVNVSIETNDPILAYLLRKVEEESDE